MSRIRKTVLAVVTLITLSLAAHVALADLTFDVGGLSTWTPLPPTCVTIQTLLPGLAPTTPPNFALLSNAGIRQCNLIQGDVATDGILLSPTLLPGTRLEVDLAFLTNEIGSGPLFNDTAEVFLEVLPTMTGPGAPIGSSQIRKIVQFSRNMLQPGGSGALSPGAIPGQGGFSAGSGVHPYSLPVDEFKGQRIFLTFTVRNAVDTAVASALYVDSVRLVGGYYDSDGVYHEITYYPEPASHEQDPRREQ